MRRPSALNKQETTLLHNIASTHLTEPLGKDVNHKCCMPVAGNTMHREFALGKHTIAVLAGLVCDVGEKLGVKETVPCWTVLRKIECIGADYIAKRIQ